jgi:hypothetical protein
VAVLVVVTHLEGGAGRSVSTLESSGLPPCLMEPRNQTTYPVAIALVSTAFSFKEGSVPALALEANLQGGTSTVVSPQQGHHRELDGSTENIGEPQKQPFMLLLTVGNKSLRHKGRTVANYILLVPS